MRQTIYGMLAAAAVMTAGAAPAMASCGGCSPCGVAYVDPCGGGYRASFSYGASYGYGGGYVQQLPDPAQYYYVNQGPVYSGPANFAPSLYYQESIPTAYYGGTRYGGGHYGAGAGWRGYGYRHRAVHRPWRANSGYYGAPRSNYRYGAARHGYGQRYGYTQRHSVHQGARHMGRPHMGGHHMGGRMGGHGHGGHMMHRR